MLHRNAVLVSLIAVAVATPALAATPAQKCQSSKNKEAGKYGFCRQKAEAKFAVTGDGAQRTAGLQKCEDKYALKWPLLESKASADGDPCPSVGDQAAIQGAVDTHTSNLATALAGGALSNCPADLADCEAAPQGQRLKTGQATCSDTAGNAIACAGTGQDGELQKGLARAYFDNGDGTVTDTRTGLMWEKQSNDGSLNDKGNTYTWANAFAVKIAGLNAGGGFAGYTDWRLPNRAELESLVDLGVANPAVSPSFNVSCLSACTVITCSCTRSGLGGYWSSSSFWDFPDDAWYVGFGIGNVDAILKTNGLGARGVRGGS